MYPETRKKRLLNRLSGFNINNKYIDQNKYFKKYVNGELSLSRTIKKITDIYNRKSRLNLIREYIKIHVIKQYRHIICNDVHYIDFINGYINLEYFEHIIYNTYKDCLKN